MEHSRIGSQAADATSLTRTLTFALHPAASPWTWRMGGKRGLDVAPGVVVPPLLMASRPGITPGVQLPFLLHWALAFLLLWDLLFLLFWPSQLCEQLCHQKSCRSVVTLGVFIDCSGKSAFRRRKRGSQPSPGTKPWKPSPSFIGVETKAQKEAGVRGSAYPKLTTLTEKASCSHTGIFCDGVQRLGPRPFHRAHSLPC